MRQAEGDVIKVGVHNVRRALTHELYVKGGVNGMHCKALLQRAHGYAMRDQRLFHKGRELGTTAEPDGMVIQEGDTLTLITDAKAGSVRTTTRPRGAAREEETRFPPHIFSYIVYVRDSNNETVPVQADETYTVGELKRKLTTRGYTAGTYRLLFGGKVLGGSDGSRDESTLWGDYQVKTDATVHMVPKPPHTMEPAPPPFTYHVFPIHIREFGGANTTLRVDETTTVGEVWQRLESAARGG
jgi:hypothetical protein